MPESKKDPLAEQAAKRANVPDNIRAGSEARMAQFLQPDETMDKMLWYVRQGIAAYTPNNPNGHFYYEGDLVWAMLRPDFKSGQPSVDLTGRQLAAMLDEIIMSDQAVLDGIIQVNFDRTLPLGVVNTYRNSKNVFIMNYGVGGVDPDKPADAYKMVCAVKNIFRELFYVKKYCAGLDVPDPE